MNAAIEIVRCGIERESTDKKVVVYLELNGEPGKVEFDDSLLGYQVSGKWASHTGFFSSCAGLHETVSRYDDATLYGRAEQISIGHYEKARELPFLVGDEHKEHGWKKISRNYHGQIEIRLPQWQEGIVAQELESLGIKQSCKLNNYWVFEKDVDWIDAKAVVAPLMAKGTRLSDEQELAGQLKESVIAQGFLPGVLMSEGGIQPSLF